MIKHLLKELDLTKDDFNRLINLASNLKHTKNNNQEQQQLRGKNIVLIFEKASTRTRCAFEVAAYDQGASVTYIDTSTAHFGKKESISDSAKVLGRFYDGIAYRGSSQRIVETLANNASKPVWNALTDEWHPTQMLADMLTMQEHCNKDFNRIKLCYLGDGRNNIANSLLITGAILGMDIRIATNKELFPNNELIEKANVLAEKSKARISITDDINAVNNIDFLYTDVWVSMGEDKKEWKHRIDILKKYRITKELLRKCNNSNIKILHCLPSIHNRDTIIGEELYQEYQLDGMEIDNESFNSSHSIVFDQAENRMHTIKAVMIDSLNNNRR